MSRSVLFVGNFLSHHGLNRQVCEDLASRLEHAGWRVRRTSTHRGRFRRFADMIASAATARVGVAHVDVFSGAAFAWAEAVSGVLRARRVPYIATLHGGALPEFAERHPRRFQSLLSGAYRVTCPSPYLAAACAGQGSVLELPNPIDLTRYPARERQRAAPRLVWLRGFRDIYEPTLAVDVLKLVRERFPAATLAMYGGDSGDGSLRATKTRISQLDLESHVQLSLAVPKEQVGARLAEHDIFLNTTTIDNAPVSVLEAMACGLAVVSTNVGGIPYLIRDDVEALLVPPGNAEGMARAVLRILDQPQLCQALSRGGLSKASRHDWSAVLPRWEELLLQAAAS